MPPLHIYYLNLIRNGIIISYAGLTHNSLMSNIPLDLINTNVLVSFSKVFKNFIQPFFLLELSWYGMLYIYIYIYIYI